MEGGFEYFKKDLTDQEKEKLLNLEKNSNVFTDEIPVKDSEQEQNQALNNTLESLGVATIGDLKKQEAQDVSDSTEGVYAEKITKLQSRLKEIQAIYDEIDNKQRVINLDEINSLEKEEEEIKTKIQDIQYLMNNQTGVFN